MLTSFYTAISGLNSNAQAINVVGNNLANLNTTSFKSGKALFAELLGGAVTTSANGNPIQQGAGSFSAGIVQNFTQGSLQYTGRSTDVAISGNGFIAISVGDGLGYTRAGNFGFNANGELINVDGFQVMGYPVNNGVISRGSALSPITIQKGISLPPQATSNLSIAANLDSKAVDGTDFSTSVQMIDSLGASHAVTLTFTKTGAGTWDWNATIPAVDFGGAVNDAPTSIGTGSLTFDENGVLTAPTANAQLTVTGLANGSADMNVTFEILDPNGKPQFTGFASESNVSFSNQDGLTSSVLIDISIDTEGIINGLFENGQVRPLAQLAIANFANVGGLLRLKGDTYVSSPASGEPSIGIAGTGGRGSIAGGALEQSNADIAQEFTNLIIAQRGYQANSRIITTSDEIYQESINMKR